MRKRIRVLGWMLVALLCVAGCNGSSENGEGEVPKPEPPAKNVILLIGDGMGPASITLGRLVGPGVHEGLEMEKMPVTGICRTFPANALVTDSAAAATALACARKTTNGTIGMSPDGADLENLSEFARKNGKSVGLVTTTTITHATPACFAVHCSERKRETEIAELYLGTDIRVLLGGGLRFFPESLQKQFRDRGYAFVRDRKELRDCSESRVIGLFSESHMDFEIDRDPAVQPSLEEMALKALMVLADDKDGFFLMIEGGRIDHACHGHDAAAAARDLVAFDLAVKTALAFAERDGETLVIVTADHSTGGLSISEKVNIERLRGQRASAEKMGRLVQEKKRDLAEVVREFSGYDATQEFLDTVKILESVGTPPYALQNAIAHALSSEAGINFYPIEAQATHLVTKGHDGEDVFVYASGPHALDFAGVHDNTEIGERIRKAMERPK